MKAIEGYWRLTDGNEGEEGFFGWAIATISVFI